MAKITNHDFLWIILWFCQYIRLYNAKWMNDWWIINRKGFGMKQSSPNQGNILAFAWKDCGKPQKILSHDSWHPCWNLNWALSWIQVYSVTATPACSVTNHKFMLHMHCQCYWAVHIFSFLSTLPCPVKHSAYISSMVRLTYSLKGIFLLR
jgi:hypothetical protein